MVVMGALTTNAPEAISVKAFALLKAPSAPVALALGAAMVI